MPEDENKSKTKNVGLGYLFGLFVLRLLFGLMAFTEFVWHGLILILLMSCVESR